jgi:hypothetical protein
VLLSKFFASISKSHGTTISVPILDGTPRQSMRVGTPQTSTPIPSRSIWQHVTRHAINALSAIECNKCNNIFTPAMFLTECTHHPATMHFEHFACPMVHPDIGKTILSYNKLMNDPATAETWKTTLGKDFGGMAQGDNKTGQKGINAMFVTTHN